MAANVQFQNALSHPGLRTIAAATVAALFGGPWIYNGAPLPGYGKLLLPGNAASIQNMGPNIPVIEMFAPLDFSCPAPEFTPVLQPNRTVSCHSNSTALYSEALQPMTTLNPIPILLLILTITCMLIRIKSGKWLSFRWGPTSGPVNAQIIEVQLHSIAIAPASTALSHWGPLKGREDWILHLMGPEGRFRFLLGYMHLRIFLEYKKCLDRHKANYEDLVKHGFEMQRKIVCERDEEHSREKESLKREFAGTEFKLEERINQLNFEKADSSRRYEDLHKEYEDLKYSKIQLHQDISLAMTENQRLSSQQRQQKQELEDCRKQQRESEAAHKQVIKDLDNLTKKNKEGLREKQSEIDALTRQLAKNKDEASRLQSDLKYQKQMLQCTEKEVEHHRNHNEALQSANADSNRKNEALYNEIERLKRENSKLHKTIDLLRAEVETQKDAVRKSHEKHHGLKTAHESELKEMEVRLRNLQDQKEQTRHLYAEHKTQNDIVVKNLKEQNSTLNKENQELQVRLKAVQDQRRGRGRRSGQEEHSITNNEEFNFDLNNGVAAPGHSESQEIPHSPKALSVTPEANTYESTAPPKSDSNDVEESIGELIKEDKDVMVPADEVLRSTSKAGLDDESRHGSVETKQVLTSDEAGDKNIFKNSLNNEGTTDPSGDIQRPDPKPGFFRDRSGKVVETGPGDVTHYAPRGPKAELGKEKVWETKTKKSRRSKRGTGGAKQGPQSAPNTTQRGCYMETQHQSNHSLSQQQRQQQQQNFFVPPTGTTSPSAGYHLQGHLQQPRNGQYDRRDGNED